MWFIGGSHKEKMTIITKNTQSGIKDHYIRMLTHQTYTAIPKINIVIRKENKPNTSTTPKKKSYWLV